MEKKKSCTRLFNKAARKYLSLMSLLVDAPPNSCSLVVMFVFRLRVFEGTKFATILEQFD